jgi:hypothetical protein
MRLVNRSRRPALPLVALVLDALAVALLVGDAIAAYGRDIPVLLVLSVIGVPVALAGAVTSGIHLVRAVRRIPRWAVVGAVVLVTLATVPIGGTAIAFAFSATPNPAARAEATLGPTVEAAGGRRLCGSGDPGLGPDNVQPYFFALYEIPTGVDVRPRLVAQAEQLGWTVSSDPGDDVTRTTPRLQIDPVGTVATGACGEYGKVERASAGTRLLQLEVLLPYR